MNAASHLVVVSSTERYSLCQDGQPSRKTRVVMRKLKARTLRLVNELQTMAAVKSRAQTREGKKRDEKSSVDRCFLSQIGISIIGLA